MIGFIFNQPLKFSFRSDLLFQIKKEILRNLRIHPTKTWNCWTTKKMRSFYSMNNETPLKLCTCNFFLYDIVRRFHWTLIERFVYCSGWFARNVNTESLEGVWLINREQQNDVERSFFPSNRYWTQTRLISVTGRE